MLTTRYEIPFLSCYSNFRSPRKIFKKRKFKGFYGAMEKIVEEFDESSMTLDIISQNSLAYGWG